MVNILSNVVRPITITPTNDRVMFKANTFRNERPNVNQIIRHWNIFQHKSMVSCQKGPTRHAYAWQIGPFWQNTLEVWSHYMEGAEPILKGLISRKTIWIFP